MRSRKLLLAITILLGAIVVTVLSVYNIDVPQDEPVITYKVGHKTPGFEAYEEVTMDLGECISGVYPSSRSSDH